nr:putative ORF1 [Marmot picobirnavirus]
MTDIQVKYWANQENAKHNRAQEYLGAVDADIRNRTLNETARSNRAREFETNRTNMVNESINAYKADTDRRRQTSDAALNAAKVETEREKARSESAKADLAEYDYATTPDPQVAGAANLMNTFLKPIGTMLGFYTSLSR